MAMTTSNSEQLLDFSVICRVCCGSGPSLPLFRVGLHRKVMSCASVQVWQNDGLPGQICKKCAAKLHISFQFKRLCEKSDMNLRRYRDSGKYIETKKKEVPDIKASIMKAIAYIPDEKLLPENQAEDSQASVSLSLGSDCSFPNCTLPSLADSRLQESIHNIIVDVTESRFEPQQNYNTNDLLGSVPDVDIPLSLSDNYNGQPLETLTLDSHFGSQILASTHSVTEQILNLEALTNSGQLQPLLNGDHSFNLLHKDFNNLEDNKDVKNITTEQTNQKKENYELLHCPVCNKVFTSNSKLNRHSRTHSDEILYRCDICNKGFIHGGNFKVHLRMHNDERPFSCNICHKSCRQRQDLDKHMRVHTGERPHVCSTCKRAFTTSSNLVAHERIHRGEKPYICSVCQKGFCQSNELSKHVRTHTGEKSHICPVCDKGFNGSSTLVVHMRIHTGEKPYVCTICNKGFTQSSCLAVHARKHKENQGHPCVRCPRSFSTAAELRAHFSGHAPANHACNEPGCVRIFSRPNDLLRHTKLFHGKQNNKRS